jgi:ArsR family transcriptional regulator, arsenate/arsenite/antimonite-responsive transcriptional repressor / arsenate reductase (thioredoxin)
MTQSMPQPPGLFQAMAHDVRWQIVTALAASDRRVQELVELVERPQNFVSYHLKQLRACGLVRERRSIADGRDVYYSLDLIALRDQFAAAGALLHPALTPIWRPPAFDLRSPLARPVRVVFLCTHNAARSQIAEALLRHMTHGVVEVWSAGTHPTTLHPYAVAALQELGVPSDHLYSKSLDAVAGFSYEYRITVCDRAREECPFLPATHMVHWSLPDPLDVIPPTREPFDAVAQELRTRIQFFLSRIQQDDNAFQEA